LTFSRILLKPDRTYPFWMHATATKTTTVATAPAWLMAK
jgi:hypothetical protein